MTAREQKKAAALFAAKWASKGYEKGECQKFWRGLLHDVFEIGDPDEWVQYEVPVATGFVDAYISRTKVLIEQKGFEHGLEDKAAMKQAMMYVGAMPDTMPVHYIILSNFQEFWIYDKHAPEMKPVKVALRDLPKKLSALAFLTDVMNHVAPIHDVAVVDRKAGALVGRLYDSLLKSYAGEIDERVLESLNMLCVRLVFCAYAEDAGVFPKRDQFVDYMRRYDAEAFRDRLAQLFRMLNTNYPDRDPEDIPALLEFPYVGSGLFDDEHIRIPRFTDETRTLLLDCMCADLDWTEINPTIFGAVFESTLSTAMRRKNGMHYTTVKNIHRVADPLFLDALDKELGEIAATGNIKKRNESLVAFQKKLGGLTFLDPACGSGNFLTETYMSLRRLENRAIELRQQGQGEFDLGDTICVTIDQFYGIEIDGFAVSVAQTALWIAESQMMIETEKILHKQIEFLPLKRYAHIVKGNALRMDWGSLLVNSDESECSANAPRHFDYILGNPPFIGHQYRTREQAEDMDAVYADWRDTNYGKLDYVSAWYKKASEYSHGVTEARSDGRVCAPSRASCAFVSTNSICQGESVAAMWKPLVERGNLVIDFAWKTFVWNSEATEKAHVHVVIVGFHSGTENGRGERGERGEIETTDCTDYTDCTVGSCVPRDRRKRLFSDDGSFVEVAHINGYLSAAPDAFLQNRGGSLTVGFAKMSKGSQPTDGGYLMLTPEERDMLVTKHPESELFIKRFVGAEEFLHNILRFCLWLKGVSPAFYRNIPFVMDRLSKVAEMRRASPTQSVRRDAETPTLFTQIRQPDKNYIIVPRHSSERRKYIPFGFMTPDVICGDANYMIPDASLYMFGIMISSVHMAWMRVVCGRLKSDYRYTPAVYNNFPWPGGAHGVRALPPGDAGTSSTSSQNLRDSVSPCEKNSCNPCNPWFDKISKTAQAILDARALYPDSSLADLYDPLTMPPELRKAHEANDAAVLSAYGFDPKAKECEIVSRLFEMYEKLTAQNS